jgi:putative Mg2+ transporter-C (MgtC) family protein
MSGPVESSRPGIGFLGAGAMFREENYVEGAGSAASIWAAGAIGLICGVGMLWLAALLAGGVLLVLVVSAPLTAKYDAD